MRHFKNPYLREWAFCTWVDFVRNICFRNRKKTMVNQKKERYGIRNLEIIIYQVIFISFKKYNIALGKLVSLEVMFNQTM